MRVLETPEGRRAYADFVRAQSRLKSLPAAFGKHGQTDLAFNNPAERALDDLAQQHAETYSITKAAGYVAVLATDQGKRLYAESLQR